MPAPVISTVQEMVSEVLRKAYGDQLVSAFFYGACTHPDFKAGSGPLEMTLVLRDDQSHTLDKGRKAVALLKKKWVHVRFFMTPSFISSASDVYPVEFLNMQLTMKPILGDDLLKSLTFSPTELRSQIEKELRGLSLHLRSEWLHMSLSDSHQKKLIDTTLHSLMPIFRAIVRLHQAQVPSAYLEIIDAVEKFSVTDGTYRKLWLKSFHQPDWRLLFDEYRLALEKTITAVDQFSLSA
jgi:hypothetical protein